MLVVLTRHGEVHVEATGNLAFEGMGSTTPFAADTICRLGSTSKPLVLTFATALFNGGSHRGEQVLSPQSVNLMTSDQLAPEQKAVSGFWPGYFDAMGWGLGMSVITGRVDHGHSVGAYGWPGLYGTAWYNDPARQATTIIMVQRAHLGDQRLPMWLDLWTAVHQAIDG